MDGLTALLMLSLLAGLATGLGGLIAIIKRPGKKIFGLLMGFAVGIMLSMSFMLLALESWKSSNIIITMMGFSIGALSIFFVDFLLPHMHFSIEEQGIINIKLLRTGVLLTLGIIIHNFPEGIAMGAGSLHSLELGVIVILTIALHNIPEGIAIALPLYTSGIKKRFAFKMALFSGLAEPFGTLIAILFLKNFQGLIPITLAFTSGVMVFITLDELVPAAHKHGHEQLTNLGVILGCITMFMLIGLM